ncbi:MAG: hypothetical protein B6242_10240 [Anaerolineaceae bacterium 4572_78]|nr:MAG: hypothetical protein B6242_10240 [Anaerolineaceae bacterium 4572_78]
MVALTDFEGDSRPDGYRVDIGYDESPFTYGCITKQDGTWNDNETWTTCGGGTPPSGGTPPRSNALRWNSAATIASGHAVTLEGNHTIKNLTINGILNADDKILTISNNGTMTQTASGQFNADTGTVAFNDNCAVVSTTPITFNEITLFGRIDFGSNSIIANLLQIDGGGSVYANPPFYADTSTLLYNSSGDIGRGLEWSTTSGAGYPYHVQISNNTTLDLSNGIPNSARQIEGNLTIDVGSSLEMNFGGDNMSKPLTIVGDIFLNGELSLSHAPDGDFAIEGDWNNNGTFFPNGRMVTFRGSDSQNINGNTTFDILSINKASNNLILNNDITIAGTAGNILRLYNGQINLNGQTMTMSNNGGNILVDGGSRIISGTSNIYFTGSKSVVASNGGSLTFAENVIVLLEATLNFGNNLTTIEGILQINDGGLAETYSPIYARSSLLRFRHAGYNIGSSDKIWQSGSTGTGVPYDVEIDSGTVTIQADKSTCGTLSIAGTATLALTGASNGATTLSLTGGDFINNGTLIPNNQSINFNGSSSPQNLTLNTPTNFYNMTVANGTTLVETGASENANIGGTLTNFGTISKTQTIASTGGLSFGLTDLNLNITTLDNIGEITVVRIDAHAPNTPARMQTGVYWTVIPTIGNSIVNLTLPHNVPSATARACHYLGNSMYWDCESSTSNETSVTLNGITSSDSLWTVGDNPLADLIIQQSVMAKVDSTPASSLSRVELGKPITYTFSFSNIGDNLAKNIVIDDAIPSDITNISMANSGATVSLNSTNPHQWNVQNLLPGESGIITITGNVIEALFGNYTFTNTVSITTSTPDKTNNNDTDFTTITILDLPCVSKVSGNWSNTSTWSYCGGNIPPTDYSAIITAPHIVSLNSNPTLNNLSVMGTLNASNGILTISHGGTITNTGIINAQNSTFIFADGGKSIGASSFNNITLKASTLDLSGATINGTLQIDDGNISTGMSANYGTDSTLRYNTGGIYARGAEWAIFNPYHVQISNNTTLDYPNGSAPDLTINGNLTIDNGSTFDMGYGSSGMFKPLTVSADVIINGTLKLGDIENGDIHVGGDWINNGGTLDHENRVVHLNGTNQTIYGSTTFAYLSKTTTSADTLTFESAQTQIITELLTLTGTENNLLTLQSSGSNQWQIDPQGYRNIAYVATSDGENLNSNPIYPTGGNDNGNNTAWFFHAVDLGISKSVEQTDVLPSEPITYTLNFSNTGPNPADSVTIYDTISISMTNTSRQFSGVSMTEHGTYPNFTWQIPTLNIGEIGTITIMGQLHDDAVADIMVSNTAEIVIAQTDRNTTDNQHAVSFTTKKGTCTSAQNGNWGDASTWKYCQGDIPPIDGVAVILAGHVIELESDHTIKAVTIKGTLNGSNSTLIIAHDGTITNTGTFSNDNNTVHFVGAGHVIGSIIFNDVVADGNIAFSNDTIINGILQLNNGASIDAYAPMYNINSTLLYNMGGDFGRGLEWSATTGAGYPNHVQISNNTILNLSNGLPNIARQIAGDLTIDDSSTLNMDDMDKHLTIKGQIIISGTFKLATQTGGDFIIEGDWHNHGSFIPQNRRVYFDGTSPQTIDGETVFDNLVINNSLGVTPTNSVTINQAMTINPDGIFNVAETTLYFTSATLNNDGIFNADRSLVMANAGLTTSGNITFYDLILMDGSNNLLGSTISHSLTISNGGVIQTGKAATYYYPPVGVGAALIYNVDGKHIVGGEWNETEVASTLEMAGMPAEVIIRSAGLTPTMLKMDSSPYSRTIKGTLTIESGAVFTLSDTFGGDLFIIGDFINDGILQPNQRHVTFNGKTMQNLTLNVPTSFDYLTIYTGTTLVETVADENAHIGIVLENFGTISKTKSTMTGLNRFGLTAIELDITTLSNLSMVTVQRHDENATTAIAESLQTGKHWIIEPNDGASSYNLDMNHQKRNTFYFKGR